jgi:hypothetical protein
LAPRVCVEVLGWVVVGDAVVLEVDAQVVLAVAVVEDAARWFPEPELTSTPALLPEIRLRSSGATPPIRFPSPRCS